MKNKRRCQRRLAPLPTFKSRKRARQVTTLFHRYSKEKEAASTVEEKDRIESKIESIGGQIAYQKASQLSTSYYSTSKWVLGCLAQNGWLFGIPIVPKDNNDDISDRRPQRVRRATHLLEIGAINTELLDSAAAIDTKPVESESLGSVDRRKYRLNVRAIDLHSMHDSIEEADFLTLPLKHEDGSTPAYDVIVCSMVLNCVPTPAKRGAMLLRIVHFLIPGGLLYFTIPKTCLHLSPYIDEDGFCRLLNCIGLNVLKHTKDSPKITFIIGQKKSPEQIAPTTCSEWRTLKHIKQGRKFRNEFAITLPDNF